MADAYVPPRVWQPKEADGPFAAINRPVAGPTHEAELPVGRHPFQLYSLATPNGKKVTILLEELLEAGKAADYDAWLIDILKGDQFSSGFVAINPNSKIPALLDRSGPEPVRVFESGSILVYLAEKFGMFLPDDLKGRTECLSWLFWQMGAQPFISGGFGHFYHYAPVKIEYAIDRYAMETKRLLDVADRRLGEARFFAGDSYSIADMALYPWYAGLFSGTTYGGAAEFLSLQDYAHIPRWLAEIGQRPGVKRGMVVNDREIMPERHEASDFDTIDWRG
ncbi:glutathione-dependent disulfide-bond oxidoreductase [Novosphingobium sp. TH158]|uniref:glutathione-dependent disulfide-bond oxidoreductase n=1 Tax=Novosphingobium sp. TH158 TaxID=2067455 RepID=UPI000C7CD3A3|nr:glutathione-dependent disulfide-bond oxidoreductase [Novosphingobium sp. TH158]PLK26979.1 glutathione-dependent disulfide-bond oxidoreductase [Novosphingobium sp. TH158]